MGFSLSSILAFIGGTLCAMWKFLMMAGDMPGAQPLVEFFSSYGSAVGLVGLATCALGLWTLIRNEEGKVLAIFAMALALAGAYALMVPHIRFGIAYLAKLAGR
ncbi:MAG: hypothetical protein JW937_02510 [Candidatus Omnitrophica bacterium]|nr:hypothetical protein [Candidatus Omnitrophota bacterium]